MLRSRHEPDPVPDCLAPDTIAYSILILSNDLTEQSVSTF